MPPKHQRKQQKAPAINRRLVSPLRGNAKSLPDEIVAQIIVDVDRSKATSVKDCQFVYRPEYSEYPLRKLRDVHRNRATNRFQSTPSLWRNTVDHALNVLALEQAKKEESEYE